jgi:hypothetical protein
MVGEGRPSMSFIAAISKDMDADLRRHDDIMEIDVSFARTVETIR